MAPLPATIVNADLRVAQQSQGGDADGSLKDWKELIDNGLAGGSREQQQMRQNHTAAGTIDDAPPSRAPGGGSSASDLMPLYCGLLGALICGLVLWIVLKQARRRARDAKLQPPAGEETDAGCRRHGGRLGDLSESRIRRLERMLDGDSRWKELAAELGHTPDSVAQLEARAHLESASPAGLLLRSWADADTDADEDTGATVDNLRRRLLAAGLTDAAAACAADERRRRHHRSKAAAATAAPADVAAGDPAAVQLTAV